MFLCGIALSDEGVATKVMCALPSKSENVLTPAQALKRLMRVNERYVTGNPSHRIFMIFNLR